MELSEQILNEANRCLNCNIAKCKSGCPVSTNIPGFINEVKQNNLQKAFEILQENNFMSEICSAICPVEKQCIGSCVRGIKDKPVQINILEKFVNDWARSNTIQYNIKPKENTNTKVAIIGSGPAGLACALELRKAGFDVTIFEKEEKYGGILEYGIPNFRLDKDALNSVIKKLQAIGINFSNNTEFGKDITIESLHEDNYKYIFLATGASKQSTYKLTEEESKNIFKSDDFLKLYSTGKKLENLGITVAIGGGNVALDSARVAAKQGAKKVYILYRRNKELMPAREDELDDAINDGVEIMFQTKVIDAQIKDGKIKTIHCIKTKIENNKPVDIENSNFEMNADTIIFAIGAKADEKFFNTMGINTKDGLLCVDENYMTNIDGIYAGGDLVETKSSVCRAIATGKKAAKAIIQKGSE